MKSIHHRRLGLAKIALAAVLVVTALAAPPAAARSAPTVCTASERVPEQAFRPLARFVKRMGIRQVAATVRTIWHIHRTGWLPACYIDKRRARRLGWGRGTPLARAAPGKAIGGDRFGNRERRLPLRGRYVEADLDTRGYRRGPKRLVFERGTKGQWLIWITTDHYRTFRKVPRPQ